MTQSMHWLTSLDERLPKYQAIYKVIASAISSGQLKVGDKLPPRRALAKKLSVTLDTMTRAFEELSSANLVSSRVGDGTYVRERNEFAEPGSLVDLSQNHPGILYEDKLLSTTLREISLGGDNLAALLNYQEDTGHTPHQNTLIKWLGRSGLKIKPSQLAVTSGAQQALYLTLRAVLRPGDSLMAEQYTYPVLQTMAGYMRLQLLAVSMDDEGLLPEELARVQTLTGSGVLYCQPSCHNPTTVDMEEGRRRRIAEMARQQDFLIIENITQAMFMEKQPQTIFELAPERTILIGSFSKLTSPGLRVGFVVAEHEWGSRIAAWLRACCWMPALLPVEVICRWIENGEMEKLLKAKNKDLKVRQALAAKILAGFDFKANPCSNYLWLRLPDRWDVQSLSTALLSKHLVVKGAEAFTVGRTAVPRAMRLSLGTPPTPDDLNRALRAMRKVLRTEPPGRSTNGP